MCSIRQTRSASRCNGLRKGFTLIETAVATMIVGLGTVAMMALLAAGTSSNIATGELTTAVDLANNIHELSAQLVYPTSGNWGMPLGETITDVFTSGNVSWLDGTSSGVSFNPPIDGTSNSVGGMSTWTQNVTVNNINPASVTATLTPNAVTNPLSRVTVTILHNGNQVYQTSWIVAAQ